MYVLIIVDGYANATDSGQFLNCLLLGMSKTNGSRDRSSNQIQTMLKRECQFRLRSILGFLRNSSAGYNVYIPTILHSHQKTTRSGHFIKWHIHGCNASDIEL